MGWIGIRPLAPHRGELGGLRSQRHLPIAGALLRGEIPGLLIGRVQRSRSSRLARTVAAIRSAASSASSCSQTLSTVQPASTRRASVSRSRSWLRRTFPAQKLSVGRGLGAVLRTAVPVAAVNEHRGPDGAEDEIGPPPHSRPRLGVHPIAEPTPVHRTTHRQLRAGVPRPVGDHRRAHMA